MLLDQYGNPIKVNKKELTNTIVSPKLSEMTRIWGNYSVVGKLTPQFLAQVLLNCNFGYITDYLILAEEMEEKDLHYSALLSSRKRAVTGLEIIVEPANDSNDAKKQAEEAEGIVCSPEFYSMSYNAMDALGKGFSVNEIIWDSNFKPINYRYIDPKLFRFDQDDNHKLVINDNLGSLTGKEIPAYKTIIHRPLIKSGLQIRGGFARLAAFAFMCKNWSVKDMMAFADIFGIPLRVGVHGVNESEENISKLLAAVVGLGNDFAATISENMKIEFPSPVNSTGGEKLFLGIADFWDKQISKAILGRSDAADSTPGKLGNETLAGEVMDDIIRDDARQLSATINRDLIKPYFFLNYGITKNEDFPKFYYYYPEKENLSVLTDALSKLVPLGLKVKMSEILEKFGLSHPLDSDEILTVGQQQLPQQQSLPQSEIFKAINREQSTKANIDDIINQLMAYDNKQDIDNDTLVNVIKSSTNKEELERNMVKMFSDKNNHNDKARERLMLAGFMAQVLGYVNSEESKL